MDTKLKSKFLKGVLCIVTLYIFAFSILCISDFVKNKKYLSDKPYFKSESYVYNLENYFSNLRYVMTEYNDYDTKTDDEKISNDDMQRIIQQANDDTAKKREQIDNKYMDEMVKAEKSNDVKQIELLIKEKESDINSLEKSSQQELSEKKKDIVAMKDNDYKNIKNSISSADYIKYYIKDTKNDKVYTNIEDSFSVNYYQNKAIHIESFGTSSSKDVDLNYIDYWFNSNGFQGKFMYLAPTKNNQYFRDYNYYNSINNRIKEEAVLFIVFLSAGLVATLVISKLKIHYYCKDKLKILYKKIPLDIRAIMLLIIFSFMRIFLSGRSFFYVPFNVGHIYTITVVAVFVAYMLFNADYIRTFIVNKESLKKEIQGSNIVTFSKLIMHCMSYKKILVKVGLVIFSSIIFGMLLAELPKVSAKGAGILICIILSIYVSIVPIYMLKKLSDFGKIIKGASEISNGNLEYKIHYGGKSYIAKLGSDITNMRNQFKKSLENELKSERLKTELITNVSHDLRTPLTSIINYVSLLKNDNVAEEEKKAYIEVLDKKSQRLKIIIEDLFEASKMSSGSVKLEMEKVDISELLRQSLGEFNEKIEKSNLTFREKIPAEEIFIILDGKKTWRVFQNLISNALKYSQPNSRVYVELENLEDRVIIIIKNMASYEMNFDVDEIFDRFKRGDKARSTEGSGLGLSIAKSIVELENGSMHIDIDGDLFKVTVEFFKRGNFIE
ncbi:HAMP domain-containing histidine kinase [Clostridium sp. 19966]|uniref:HAMP domain-containing sensor histidine kinase n=1 Tax=Clostridium sp. 19966 TaxID=2768166 RepID=UPI0028DECE3D|nr:HAMP domain-containing sensor histidine kinase [Clostridium sp. 19966]MDT8715691.1 HAMP domain-containing histidine kinase [Clostridium sp. 19966]